MLNRRYFLGSLLASASSPLLAQSAPTANNNTATNLIPASARLRIAQIGTQHAHASGKLDAVLRNPDFEVVGVSGAENAKAAIYSGVPKMDEATLLSQPGLRAVLVETAIGESCSSALRALRAGLHVHLDKPGALEHTEFSTMRREAVQRRLTVQMGYMLRYNPAFQLLFQAHREGWLGEILEVDAMMGKLADPATRRVIGALPGGGMFELACHTIDAVVTLLGKPLEVHAFSTPTNPEEPVKDNQLAVLVYRKATVTIRCNHADPFGNERRRFQVAGTRGAIEILPLESGRATLSLNLEHPPYKKGSQSLALSVPKGRYDGEFADFASVLRGEKQLQWDAAHDIAVHETVLRAAGLTV
jgi:predicted dehydrogenase